MSVDTYVDEIAVSRALRADREVWANLTRYEREEALVRVRERRLAEQAENAEWSHILRTHAHAGGALPFSYEHPEWLVEVARAAGYRHVESMLAAGWRVARQRAVA